MDEFNETPMLLAFQGERKTMIYFYEFLQEIMLRVLKPLLMTKNTKQCFKSFLRVQPYKNNRDPLFIRIITWTFITSIGTMFTVYLTSLISSVITYPGARQHLALVFSYFVSDNII